LGRRGYGIIACKGRHPVRSKIIIDKNIIEQVNPLAIQEI
jgi:hypothetical protein